MSFRQDLVITGVFSADAGSPNGVELLVINNITDLSIYGLGSANDGGGTDGQEFHSQQHQRHKDNLFI